MNIHLGVKIYKGQYNCFGTICGYDHFELSGNKEVAIQKMKEKAIQIHGGDVKFIIDDQTAHRDIFIIDEIGLWPLFLNSKRIF